MKKQTSIALVLIAALIILGLFYWKNKSFQGVFAPRVTILAPADGEAVFRNGEYSLEDPIFVQGKSTPGNSIYVFDNTLSCVDSDTISLGGGSVNQEGDFSLSLSSVKPGNNMIKAMSVSEQEENEHKKGTCYPDKFFSSPINFVYSAQLEAVE